VNSMKGVFITGTDTEIGKTCITAALTHLLMQQGWRVAPIKPVAAGQELVDGRWINEDVQRLCAASAGVFSDAEIGPLQYRTPCAPHIAAALEHWPIAREAVLAAIGQTAARAEFSVIEGVGGFRVPLAPGWDSADLARDLALPVVLVVGLRLGCINHALLSAEAIRARGLSLASWVANTVDAHMPHVADNLAALDDPVHGLGAPRWGLVPRLPEPTPAAVAAYLDRDRVLAALSK